MLIDELIPGIIPRRRNEVICGILTGKNDQMILSFCYFQKREVKEIAAKLGIVPSTYFRNNVLKRLVDEGYLLSFKEGKSVTYIANKRKVHV